MNLNAFTTFLLPTTPLIRRFVSSMVVVLNITSIAQASTTVYIHIHRKPQISEKYAATTDIEKAFLHVVLHPTDRDVTRLFWLSVPSNPKSSFATYGFKSVLFGATLSSFILKVHAYKTWIANRPIVKLYPQEITATEKIPRRC